MDFDRCAARRAPFKLALMSSKLAKPHVKANGVDVVDERVPRLGDAPRVGAYVEDRFALDKPVAKEQLDEVVEPIDWALQGSPDLVRVEDAPLMAFDLSVFPTVHKGLREEPRHKHGCVGIRSSILRLLRRVGDLHLRLAGVANTRPQTTS